MERKDKLNPFKLIVRIFEVHAGTEGLGEKLDL